jgi:hypothetical protein
MENKGQRTMSVGGTMVEFFDHDHVREKWIETAALNEPLVLVRERTPGNFEAVCGLGLNGVAHRRDAHKENRNETNVGQNRNEHQYLDFLLAGMDSQQRIDFIYTSCINSGTEKDFAWKIVNSSTGNSQKAAVLRLNQLYENLAVILALEKDYLFAPLVTREEFASEELKRRWKATIHPRGVALRGARPKTIGFSSELMTQHREAGTVLVSTIAPIAGKNLDCVASGSLVCPASLRVVVSITPVSLSAGDLQKVASALEWLREGDVKGIKYHSDVEAALEEAEMLNRVNCNLELWVKNPRGYRIACSVFSENPIPSAFLSMLARELFQGCPVSIHSQVCDGESNTCQENLKAHSADRLDLSDCVNSASGLLPIFPSVSSLTEAGANRFYRSPHLNLSESGLLLGHIGYRKSQVEVRFHPMDRDRHCYMVGATGTGKSTLLFNMITQDIENGEGVAVIDPHGDLYDQLLTSIPRERIKDVILINPCDAEYPVGINFLECQGSDKSLRVNFIANEMMKIFERLYDLRIAGGPMFEQYMRNALMLLMESDYPATLVDVPLLFEDKEFRSFLLSRCKNPYVVSFWSNIAEKAGGETSLSNMAPYVTSKLNLFTANALLSPIIGQVRSTIDFREAMDTGKILLVNLSKGILGELDVQLLGLVLIDKIFSSAMSRVALPPTQRKPLYLYVDEFQNFTTDTVAFLLSEGRKFGLYLTLANQNLSQLAANHGKQNLLDAVLGNVGTVLAFRMGAMDAEKMQVYTKPELQAQDLQDLPNFHVAARLLVKNAPTRAFVFRTLSPSHKADIDAAEIISASRRKYARPRKQVEREIIKHRSCYQESKP